MTMKIFLDTAFNNCWPTVLWDTKPTDRRYHCIVTVSGYEHSKPGIISIEHFDKVAPIGGDYEL
jgi:hypothetical protein